MKFKEFNRMYFSSCLLMVMTGFVDYLTQHKILTILFVHRA